jgi:Protein of unknown function (DUF2800)
MAQAHCEFAPSAFERIAACPATVQRSRGMPDEPSKWAAEGTFAHTVAAEELARALGWEGDYSSRGFNRPEVDDELRAAVELYVDTVIGVVDRYNDFVWVEQRIDLAPFNPPAPLWGTSDAAIFKPATGHLIIPDFKYGKGIPVEVRNNLQLRIYAGGVIAGLKGKGKIKRVDLIIVQPRARHAEGPVRMETTTADEIVMELAEIFGAMIRALQPNAPAYPGDHCRWCPAAPTCPEYRQAALSVAQDRFGNVPEEHYQLPQPINLSDNDLGAILARGALFETWLEQIRQHAHHRAEHGYHIPGWKLVAKRATRKWRDEAEAEATLRYSLGEEYALHTTKLKSPAQLEKEIGKKDLRAFHDLIVAESSGTTLAADYDNRPGVAGVDSQARFAELPAPNS